MDHNIMQKKDFEEINIVVNTNILSNIKDKIFFTLKNYIFGSKKFEIYYIMKNKGMRVKNVVF